MGVEQKGLSPTIHIHIERLVLHGYPAHQQQQISAAFEQELSRAIAEGGLAVLLQERSSTPGVEAGSVRTHAGGNPEQVGREVAQAVYTCLTSNAEATRSGGGST